MTSAAETTLSQRLWAGGEPIYRQILAHPFLAGLATGELSRERFRLYIEQDALYLSSYAEALRATGELAGDPAITRMFHEHADEALAAEGTLHAGLLSELGDTERPLSPTPTTTAYCNYLLATTARGTFTEAVTAILPCYWIYWEVGKELVRRSSPDPLYARWIANYGADAFGDTVAEVIGVTDQLGVGLTSPSESAAMARFVVACRYEWMFWDAAYRLETWPV